MNTSIEQQRSKSDHQYLNYITLSTIVAKSMREEKGALGIDFDLASDIAWKISAQIPSNVLLQQAKTLTVDEILQHGSVKMPS